jgi:ADP-ribose pyrophosphatase
VEYLGERHLEPTEDIVVYELEEAEVRELLETGEIKQALMAAPLWKYFALKK